jgi:hypothetical protein
MAYRLLFDKGQSLALFSGAAGAADAMDVIFICRRQIVVYDMADIRDINTSSSHVGGNQNLQMIALEKVESFLALWLIFVAVNGF